MRILGYRERSDIKWGYREIIIQERHIREKFWHINNLATTNNLDDYFFALNTNIGIIEAPTGEMDRVIAENKMMIFLYHKALIITENFKINMIYLLTKQNKIIKYVQYNFSVEKNNIFRVDFHMYFD